MKLQLLQPRAGVCPTPFASALAAGAADTAATLIRGTAVKAATSPRINLRIESPPRSQNPLRTSYAEYPNPVNISRTPT
jgi:hypothetical protein